MAEKSHTERSDSKKLDNSQIKDWFENVIGQLNLDKFLMVNDYVSNETKAMYSALISGEETDVHAYGRIQSSKYFIQGIISAYFETLREKKVMPLKFAMELSDAKILVWAEINDDDFETEDALLIAEAKANAKFGDYGFHISTTIVEQSDNLNIPSHYFSVLDAAHHGEE